MKPTLDAKAHDIAVQRQEIYRELSQGWTPRHKDLTAKQRRFEKRTEQLYEDIRKALSARAIPRHIADTNARHQVCSGNDPRRS